MTKPKKTSVHVVLEGNIFIEERKGKKVISREELDGNVVLALILEALEQGMIMMKAKYQKARKDK